MDYRQAFNNTLRHFGITAKSLSLATGVQERQISLFRNGKDLMTETFFQLVAALPEDAQRYFFAQLASKHPSDLQSLVATASLVEKAQVLNLIVNSLVEKVEKVESLETNDSEQFLQAAG